VAAAVAAKRVYVHHDVCFDCDGVLSRLTDLGAFVFPSFEENKGAVRSFFGSNAEQRAARTLHQQQQHQHGLTATALVNFAYVTSLLCVCVCVC
jgi:hypothetical protein